MVGSDHGQAKEWAVEFNPGSRAGREWHQSAAQGPCCLENSQGEERQSGVHWHILVHFVFFWSPHWRLLWWNVFLKNKQKHDNKTISSWFCKLVELACWLHPSHVWRLCHHFIKTGHILCSHDLHTASQSLKDTNVVFTQQALHVLSKVAWSGHFSLVTC